MDGLYNWSDATKIGVALTGFGCFFTFLGFLMFLDSAMLTLGNLLFVTGVCMILGPQNLQKFFIAERSRWRASACFFCGILLVMLGYCFIGLLVQCFGGLNLFGNFFPIAYRMLEVLPYIGPILRHPQMRRIADFIGSLTGGPSNARSAV